MWARMQEMGIRREAPLPLEPGMTVDGYRIKETLKPVTGFRRYTAMKDWQGYELRQFYDVNTDAFLRWQNQARLVPIPHSPSTLHAHGEWSGGFALPDHRLPSLGSWLPEDHGVRVTVGASLAALLCGLHRAGYVHHDLHPGAVLLRRDEPVLRHFSRCALRGHQDLWHAFAGNRDPFYAAPEQVAGQRGTAASDVYAFGLILMHLFEERLPPRWLKLCLCTLHWGWDSARTAFTPRRMPQEMAEIVSAALAQNPADRPSMEDVCKRFGIRPLPIPTIPPPERRGTDKILALISADAHDRAIFHRASELGSAGASVLVVSLVPVNLVYGELELFKVRLFRKLARGLRELRANGVDWGILFRENVDPNAAVRQICQRLEPDLVLCGPPSRRGVGARVNPGVGNVIAQTGCEVERPSNMEG